MDRKSQNVLTLGVQWGQVTRTLGNLNGLELEWNIVNDDFTNLSPELAGLNLNQDNEPESSYNDLSVGLLLKSKLSKTSSMEFGVAGRHLIRPEYNFETSTGNNQSPHSRTLPSIYKEGR